jgi:hypothetical protein
MSNKLGRVVVVLCACDILAFGVLELRIKGCCCLICCGSDNDRFPICEAAWAVRGVMTFPCEEPSLLRVRVGVAIMLLSLLDFLLFNADLPSLLLRRRRLLARAARILCPESAVEGDFDVLDERLNNNTLSFTPLLLLLCLCLCLCCCLLKE